MSNIIQELREIAIDMVEGMNIIAENYNALISIKEKVINLQKDINNIRSKYMSQNLLEKCFEILREMVVRSEDVPSISSLTKNINKVGLDMPSHSGKIQATTNVDNIRTEDYPCLKTKISQNVSRKCLSFKRIKA